MTHARTPADASAVDYAQFPDARGRFGRHGGRFVSETLMAALDDLDQLYAKLKNDPEFLAEFDHD
ncbi:MAG: tryptophan synthase subunit beta, partial [Moraxellaceae bacterium]|nr:tryptophan synthase subunit beta [Moraxellaceae bacterium]